MKLCLILAVFCAALGVGAWDGDREEKKDVNHLELLLAKLESIENKLQSMEIKLLNIESKQRKLDNIELHLQIIENQINDLPSTQGQNLSMPQKDMVTTLQKLDSQVTRNFNALQNLNQEKVLTALQKLDTQVTRSVNVLQTRKIQQKIDAVWQKLDEDVGRVLQNQYSQHLFPSCKDVPSNVSGIYQIRVKSDSEPIKVYCEQRAFGGGWIVIQYRYDGSLDFYRGWNEFRDGFGDLKKEFWLGLEKVHQITKGRKHELIVELKDFDENYVYARYDGFEIGSEIEQYSLKDLGNYSGTVGDVMTTSKRLKFSTKDRDNDDNEERHCAQYHEGGWWHENGMFCTFASLNGRYLDAHHYKSMHWFTYKNNWIGMSFSRMMIREVE